jgi:hypothetical protein
MAHSATAERNDFHPAPHRDRVGLGTLAFITLGPPLAWGTRLVVNYGSSSYACYPASEPLNQPLASLHWVWALLIGLDLVGMALCLAALAVAYRTWRVTKHELQETGPPLIEIGDGRTRFFAIWGILIGIGFFVAILFDFVGLWVIPLCL